METFITASNSQTLAALPLGARLLVRSRKDWRVAVISRIAEGSITISVASPGGSTYRLRRVPEAAIVFDGRIPFLHIDDAESWRENFCCYDARW